MWHLYFMSRHPDFTQFLATPEPPELGPGPRTGVKSQAELEAQLRKELDKFPGVEYEFSQELEMRNDELISGFNTPIAIFLKVMT